jgi:Fe2+ transport system protein FeoA
MTRVSAPCGLTNWSRYGPMQGGCHLLSRLASLGFTPGACLQVVQNSVRSPIIVNLRDTRVAPRRSDASMMLVDRLEGADNGR